MSSKENIKQTRSGGDPEVRERFREELLAYALKQQGAQQTKISKDGRASSRTIAAASSSSMQAVPKASSEPDESGTYHKNPIANEEAAFNATENVAKPMIATGTNAKKHTPAAANRGSATKPVEKSNKKGKVGTAVVTAGGSAGPAFAPNTPAAAHTIGVAEISPSGTVRDGLTLSTVRHKVNGNTVQTYLPPLGIDRAGTTWKCTKCPRQAARSEFFANPTNMEQLFGTRQQCAKCLLTQLLNGKWKVPLPREQ